MKSAVNLDTHTVIDIEFQPASLDIWDAKYRLTAKDGSKIDESIDDTYKRVAQALANVEVESKREHYFEEFVWALRCGAIPAGRIMSNAGAQEHKPATSTINCTVSGTVGDSMDNILNKVHEAGLTLKAGCGIGYEFSTLRPKGAYVTGAGAYTSGPLSFMDMFHGFVGRRASWRTDGYFRCWSSGCHGIYPCEARRRSPASVQPFAARYRRIHAGRYQRGRLETRISGNAQGGR
jgi:ribonucleotide reductase alpha subunit